jgi:GTPase
MKFVDEVTIEVASGHGGPGKVSFRREKFVPRGGPDGGDGGAGGDVIIKASTRLHSLLDLKLKTKYRAGDGEGGGTQKRAGKDGQDLLLFVPPGTMIKDENGTLIKDLGHDEEFLFLEGGIGGKGNPFYMSSVNQAPGVAQKGMPGQERTIHLELKLLADVGIIGFPNAGKSTLISHISAAKPKVADYPFTTLVPNLGVVRFGEDANFIVADMPGLIKGAHEGAGLGTRFLRHIERTKFFVHLIDAGGLNGRDPLEDYYDINYELEQYDKAHEDQDDFSPLATRPQIVALNKIDVLDEDGLNKVLSKFEKEGVQVALISAATGRNLKELVFKMGDLVFNGEIESKIQKSVQRKIKKTKGKVSGKKAKAGQRVKKIILKKAGKKVVGKKTKGVAKKGIQKGSRKAQGRSQARRR